ncbi:MAG: hypothetical protein K1X89_31960 [Myxococcaceae bacterium]|nr:hypothetical protein [Myxococcaceae bacterium]
MRAELALAAAALLSACQVPLTIGTERRESVAALAVDPVSGDFLQAGFRFAARPDEATSDLWYGRVDATGQFRHDATTVDVAGGADAVRAAARVTGGWVLAGQVTDAAGQQVAWVRRLDDAEATLWTVELGRAGTSTSARAVAVAADQTVVVGGVEVQPGGALDGWLARLGTDGQVLWRSSFATDYQRMASGNTVLGLALIAPSVNQIYTIGQRNRGGAITAGGLQLSLAGDLFDSHPLPGREGGALFADGYDHLDACVTDESGGLHLLRMDRAFVVSGDLPLQAQGARLELGGCAQSPTTLWLGATAVHTDGSRVPFVAAVGLSPFTTPRTAEVTQPEGTTVLSVATHEASTTLGGRTEALLRRWMTGSPAL